MRPKMDAIMPDGNVASSSEGRTLLDYARAQGENKSLSGYKCNMFAICLYPKGPWCNIGAGKYLSVAPWPCLVRYPPPPPPPPPTAHPLPTHWLFLNFSFTTPLTPRSFVININCFLLSRKTFMVWRERGTVAWQMRDNYLHSAPPNV